MQTDTLIKDYFDKNVTDQYLQQLAQQQVQLEHLNNDLKEQLRLSEQTYFEQIKISLETTEKKDTQLKQAEVDLNLAEKRNRQLEKELHDKQQELDRLRHSTQLQTTVTQTVVTKSTQVQPELMSQLVEYMPAIFQGFWSIVSPNELMKTIGAKEKPIIALPPSYNEILAIIVHIQKLPKHEQTVIANICQQLQQKFRLQPHGACLYWLQKMEK